jgi:serine phosphatase RsbU (regulator of sigma subunit)
MNHYNKVYLIFFKAYKQEVYLLEAIAKKNIAGIEQNKNALQTIAEEGLQAMKSLKGYNNDPTLLIACREALKFYKSEADQIQFTSELILKEEAFSKMKKSFETKPASQRTQKDVDEFNKEVNEINAVVKSYNLKNNQINKERDKALNNWNNAVKSYLDTYTPVQRKG